MEGTRRRQRHPLGIELILPDWFYAGVLDAALVLTIDPAYFRLKGGIERWLYRLVRKHGGRQEHGWQFDFRHLYRKSGSAAASRTSPTTCAPWWRGSRCPATSSASSGCRTTTPSC